MAKTISLKAQIRTGTGRSAAKALRAKGEIPGVIYGKRGTWPVQINSQELSEALHHVSSENVLVDLQLSGGEKAETKFVFLQEVEHHYLQDNIVHVDLHEIAADEEIHVEVPVVEVGEPVGVRVGGGLMETILRRLRVSCLPKYLPEQITVDVSALEIGQAIHVGQIALPEGVTVLNPKDQSVVAVHAPLTEDEAKAAESTAPAAAATEPEVLKEKKEAAPAAEGDKKK
ncbi:MAG: 50S ribosomal protein L25 [Verrucomicrobium sp.]|nr:50S ribosomal protein L25 [Verrucomicrobium sp.]